jgi:hypothetical protein
MRMHDIYLYIFMHSNLIFLMLHCQGKRGNEPVHVYANPLDPVVCPILCLAVMIFSRSHRITPQLFPGQEQHKRFCVILRTVLDRLTDAEQLHLGNSGSPEYLGSHSTRKGAASYVGTMNGGPSGINVYLRARWSLGSTQNRYLYQGEGGDQVVGRVLSGLNYDNSQFSTLLPHFSSQIETTFTAEMWISAVTEYSTLPTGVKQALPYLLASIVFHLDFLRKVLDDNHPLFSTPLFTSGVFDLRGLREHVLCGQGQCPASHCGLRATGVPPHLAIVNEVVALISRSDELRNEMKQMGIELPDHVAKQVLAKCEVQGAVPCSRDDLNQVVEALRTSLLSSMSEKLNERAVSEAKQQESTTHPVFWEMYCWGGKLRYIPQTFRVPRTNCKDCWFMWHFGNRDQKIAPLSCVPQSDLDWPGDEDRSDSEKSQFSRIKKVMKVLVQLAAPFHQGKDLANLSREEHSVLFDKAFDILMRTIGGSRYTRPCDIAIGTIYKRIIMYKSSLDEGEVPVFK